MTTAEITFFKGMRVTSSSHKFPGSGTVEKVLPVNVKVKMDDGRLVTFARSFLRPEGEAPVATVVALPDYLAFPAGTVVRFKDERAVGRFGGGLYVVIKNGGDRINVAKMGGDNDRYVRAPAASLVRVPLTEVASHL